MKRALWAIAGHLNRIGNTLTDIRWEVYQLRQLLKDK